MKNRRRLLRYSFLLVLVSVVASAYLTRLHVRVNTDPTYQAGCDLNATLRCSDIALSPYSVVAGVPIAVWALAGYACFLFFILRGLWAPLRAPWPTGLYWLLSALTLATTLIFAFIAEIVIGALCIGCLILYVTNTALFTVACVLLRADPGALRRDLSRLPTDRAAVGFAIVMLVVAGALVARYPAYWEFTDPTPCAGPDGLAAGFNADGSCWIGAVRAPVLDITEFSDYRCPFCRRAHAQVRELVKQYSDRVRVTHKHFPLDRACNPAMRRQLHPDACRMAKMAYCAGRQGKFWPMNDVLFSIPESQKLDPARLGVAAGVGDAAAFLHCLDAPAASAHVRRDIEEGLRLRISGTPTFLIDGALYKGRIPEAVLRRTLGLRNGARDGAP